MFAEQATYVGDEDSVVLFVLVSNEMVMCWPWRKIWLISVLQTQNVCPKNALKPVSFDFIIFFLLVLFDFIIVVLGAPRTQCKWSHYCQAQQLFHNKYRNVTHCSITVLCGSWGSDECRTVVRDRIPDVGGQINAGILYFSLFYPHFKAAFCSAY